MSKRSSQTAAAPPDSHQPVPQPPNTVIPAKAGISDHQTSLSSQRLLELYDRVADAPNTNRPG